MNVTAEYMHKAKKNNHFLDSDAVHVDVDTDADVTVSFLKTLRQSN